MEQEIITKLAAKLLYYAKQDWEFRRIIQEVTSGPEQKKLEITSQEERERIKAKILQKKKELELEEKSRRQRMIVDEIKKDFWKGRGRGMAREADRKGPSQRYP